MTESIDIAQKAEEKQRVDEKVEQEREHLALALLIEYVVETHDHGTPTDIAKWRCDVRYVLGGTVAFRGFAVPRRFLDDINKQKQAKTAYELLQRWSYLSDVGAVPGEWSEWCEQAQALVDAIEYRYIESIAMSRGTKRLRILAKGCGGDDGLPF
jgi:hypothetical protein